MVAVVAHRGASDVAAEHTLAAYQAAVAAGADAVECDVRLSADGHLVCVHDRRVDRTSDGAGAVSALELADLATLDFGSWRGGEVGVDLLDDASRRVLTLRGLLGYLADAGWPAQLAVETKHPTRAGPRVERALVDTLDRFGLAHPRLGRASPVRVMSFSAVSLRRMRAAAPSVPAVYLMGRVPLHRRDGRLPVHVGAAGPALSVLRAHPEYVARLHARGAAVHVWTVDEPDDLDFVLDLGVDAVITNRPAAALAAVAARSSRGDGP